MRRSNKQHKRIASPSSTGEDNAQIDVKPLEDNLFENPLDLTVVQEDAQPLLTQLSYFNEDNSPLDEPRRSMQA